MSSTCFSMSPPGKLYSASVSGGDIWPCAVRRALNVLLEDDVDSGLESTRTGRVGAQGIVGRRQAADGRVLSLSARMGESSASALVGRLSAESSDICSCTLLLPTVCCRRKDIKHQLCQASNQDSACLHGGEETYFWVMKIIMASYW